VRERIELAIQSLTGKIPRKMRKNQFRNSNFEIRNKLKWPSPSIFEFRTSDFEFPGAP
jgi:hypothetical protein